MTKNIKYSIYSLLLLLVVYGCSKPDPISGTTAETALISITNVNASAKSIDFFIDGVKANQFSAIGANANVLGTYIGTTSGNHSLEVRDATSGAVYASTNITVEGGQTYSAFVYDVTTSGTLKLLFLKTDRALPDEQSSKIRFLNLSPGSPALDVWLIRRSGGVNTADSSAIYSNVTYAGSTIPDVNTLSAFKTIRSGSPAGAPGATATQDYIVRLKLAGTNTAVATSGALTFLPGKIYTLYIRGTYPSVVFALLLQNP